MESHPSELKAFYRRYLQRCNEHRFHDLEDFVADHVEVNGVARSRQQYGAGLRDVIEQFPDFHWDLQHLLVDENWLAAHLDDTGTATTGRSIAIREFAVYRIDGGRIGVAWGDLNPDRFGSG